MLNFSDVFASVTQIREKYAIFLICTKIIIISTQNQQMCESELMKPVVLPIFRLSRHYDVMKISH